MKIGIVTVQDSSNYGSYLQAYALQKTLERMGHKVYFIRTRDKSYIRGLFFGNIKPYLKRPVKLVSQLMDDIVKYNAFRNEWKVFRTIDNATDVKLDCIILGSDEIWNCTNKTFRKPIFYGVGLPGKILTYGISISRARKEHFDKFPELKKAIRNIDPILVRDENTKKVIDDITGKESIMVSDPTFLCDVSEYNSPTSRYNKIPKKYMLIYSYEFNDNIKANIKRFAKENGLLIVSACIKHGWEDIYVNGSPLSFCSLLRDAEFVVTTTFHGTVFSILNHKRFVAEPYSPKVNDVLNKVGLNDSLVEVGAAYDEFALKLKQTLDYKKVDVRILDWRERSIKALEKELM